MDRMSGCVFCDITAGRSEASVVYRDSRCMAIMDISPINAGHVLVIPLTHANDLAELEPGTGGALCSTAPANRPLQPSSRAKRRAKSKPRSRAARG